MGNRTCPLCFVKLPQASVVARSDELVCPSCHSALEVSRHSRVVAALLGVVAAYAAVAGALVEMPRAAWVLAVVAAVLAYGVVSALFLYFVSDLVIRPSQPEKTFPQIHG